MERLQKVIANRGYCSRRKAEELIQAGKVWVNGQLVTELGFKVNATDYIEVEGNALGSANQKVYYLLNKPRGVVSTAHDEKGRTTVVDLIDTNLRIYPIGRLDYDTTGLILLTNDGELANLLMHPKNEIEKTYLATIEGSLTPSEFYALKKGIVLDNQKIVIDYLKVKKTNEFTENVLITLHEGQNHIVKKLFLQVGHKVVKLKRESYAFLTLEGVPVGQYRSLTIKEVKKLYSLK